MRQASAWLIGWSDKVLAFQPLAVGEQPAFALLRNAGRFDVRVQLVGQFVVAGDDALLAAFLAQAQLPAGAARAEILDPYFQCGTDAGETVG